MEVFFTQRDLLRELGSRTELAAVLDREPVREGMPFILDADGSYDVHLNRFFRALPTLGCRSANSWEGYARDLALWGGSWERYAVGRCGMRTGRTSTRSTLPAACRSHLFG
ncbi:hypothetical protein QFZ49_006000 [Streptomyces turgidiscabies]|uniref:Uncharacterized protein n=1 Tax=Streptomyces turgidiscabies TaxID=85558 RepID=A0ABU0RWG3_9ACTN|nr:hypothetical protein [Streptomyces turgidiscabies]